MIVIRQTKNRTEIPLCRKGNGHAKSEANAVISRVTDAFDIVEVIGSSPTNPTYTASLANAGFAVFLCGWKYNYFAPSNHEIRQNVKKNVKWQVLKTLI